MIDRRRVFLAGIYAVFFLSGFAALIYQTVWQRAFTLYYGVGAISTTLVVSIFLLGLGAGAYCGGWLAERAGPKRLKIYVALEMALGIMGAFSLQCLSWVTASLSRTGYLLGFLIIGALIATPILIMGTTLPMVVKIMNGVRRDYGQTLSRLYCVNTLGAAVGALASAYWLIPFRGFQATVWVAAGINLAIAGGVSQLARAVPTREVTATGARPIGGGAFTPAQAAAIVFLTGFLAIGYQMVWFRIIGTLLKFSAYVLPTVLFVYLAGLAAGSYATARSLDRRASDQNQLASRFFLINLGIPLYILLIFLFFYASNNPVSNWMLATSFDQQLHPSGALPVLGGHSGAASLTSVYLFADVLIWPVALVFPAACLMGASFPLLNVLVIRDGEKEGYETGLIYALTVVGNVAGGLVTGFLLLPWFGTEMTVLGFVGAGLFWGFGVRRLGGYAFSRGAAVTAFAALLTLTLAILPERHGLYDRMHPTAEGERRVITEGRDAVVLSRSGTHPDGQEFAQIYIGGTLHASLPSASREVEVLETVTYAPSLQKVLIIGFGGGEFVAALLRLPETQAVTVLEIADTLMANLRQIPSYGTILGDPRVRIVIEDARRHLQRNAETYDVVLMDPLYPTTAYANNLYSKEFFELIRGRLKPGGVMMTWFSEYMVIPRTLARVFPEMKCFSYFCLSGNAPLQKNEARRTRFMATVAPTLRQAMLTRMNADLYEQGSRDETLERTSDYPINTDFSPVTEYYLGSRLRLRQFAPPR